MDASNFFKSPVSDVATAVGFVAGVAVAILVLRTIPPTKKALGL